MNLGGLEANPVDLDGIQGLDGSFHFERHQIDTTLLLVILDHPCQGRVSGVLKLFENLYDIAAFEHQEVSCLGEIPYLVPKVGPTVYATFISDVHAVTHEHFMQDHIGVAEIARMANIRTGFRSIFRDDLVHLLRSQSGPHKLAELVRQRIHGGSERGGVFGVHFKVIAHFRIPSGWLSEPIFL